MLGLPSRDWRVTKEYLAHVRFAVLALGDSLYGANYATVGKTVHAQLAHIGSGRGRHRGWAGHGSYTLGLAAPSRCWT